MSVLAAAVPSDSALAETPRILSFPNLTTDAAPQDVVTRARLMHHNSRCRSCGKATVDPIELDDALLNRWGLPIPGTATIVGFACGACGNEWSTQEPHLKLYAPC